VEKTTSAETLEVSPLYLLRGVQFDEQFSSRLRAWGGALAALMFAMAAGCGRLL
jgi:hypothetical protein